MAQVDMHGVMKKAPFVLFLIFLAALSFIFRDGIAAMTQSWQQEEYSHGYLIPLLSLVLLLNKMPEARMTPRTWGLSVGIIALLIPLQFIFQFAGVYGLSAQMYLISSIALFGLFWGMNFVRFLAGPLGLLFFCAPLPKLVFYPVSFGMQMLSSSLGSFVLGLIGVSVFQDGNIIDLGGYKLEVAEACNGLRYLFPLVGISFLLAYMYEAPFWKRATVFLSAAPIAILMNGLRIALIGITVDLWGPAMAEGLLHEAEGMVVFLGCVLLLLLEITILQKIGRKGILRFDALRMPSLRNLPAPVTGKPTAIAAAILGIGFILSVVMPPFLADYLKPVPLRQSLVSFPLQIGEWVGRSGPLDAESLKVLGTHDYFLGDYAAHNTAVNLYMLYYPQQDNSSNQAAHTPTICIPAGGWEILSQNKASIPVPGRAPLTVNALTITKGSMREIVYYWFVQDGFETADPEISRLHILKNAITTGRTDGAMIRMTTTIGNGEDTAVAVQRLDGFLDESLPTIMGYMFASKGDAK